MTALPDSTLVYRAYSRKLDEDGHVQDKDFLLRDNEPTLSVALTGEKAVDELDVRGYAPLVIREIRKIGLDTRPKEGQADSDLLEIVNIPFDDRIPYSITLAAISAQSGKPVETPNHRKRIRSKRRPLN